MPTFLPEFKDTTPEEARKQGANLVQLKWDGWFSEITIDPSGLALQKSKTDRVLRQFDTKRPSTGLTIIQGEYMFGTQFAQNPGWQNKTICYDLLMLDGKNLTGASYAARYTLLRGLLVANKWPDFQLCACYEFDDVPTLQAQYLEDMGFEGYVFRDFAAVANKPIWRHKTTVIKELEVVGAVEGEGALQGMLGAFVVKYDDGSTGTVGGGLDKALRAKLWLVKDELSGLRIECEGKKVFESGKLRHPNFVRFVSTTLPNIHGN